METDLQESKRVEVQLRAQSLVNQHLLSSLDKLTKKSYEEQKTLENSQYELANLKSTYSNFMIESESRETSLLLLLEQKDQNISECVNQLELAKMTADEISDENSNLEKKLKELQEALEKAQCNCPAELLKAVEALADGLENVESQCEDENVWTENIKKIQRLEKELTDLKKTYAIKYETVVDSDMEKVSDTKFSQNDSEEKLAELQKDFKVLSENYSILKKNNEELLEKFGSSNMAKETLLAELEKSKAMLDQETLNSQKNFELLAQEHAKVSELQEALFREKMYNERISEEVIKEKISFSKVKSQLQKMTDLDTVLEQTLKTLGMEESIKKSEEGYIYNNTQLSLSLHTESFIIVKIGAGLVPLTDFLTNPIQPKVASKTSGSIHVKSPLNTSSSRRKTPLRENNSEKRQIFKY